MSYKSHKSPISALLEVLDAWRKGQNKSRETTAEEIVCAHERIDGPARTGVFFEPRTTDVFKRMHTNAARFFRWMDDESKDTNLLSVNLLPSVLAALPESARIHWLNDYLRPLGLSVRSVEQEAGAAIDVNKVLRANLKESAEAHCAMVDYAENPSEETRRRVERELAEQEEVAHKARMLFSNANSTVSSIAEARAA